MTTEELEKRLKDAKVPVTPAGYVRRRDVARLLNRAPRTLREWSHDGFGPKAEQEGRRGTWYHVSELAAFITNNSKD
jgi:hypothetical protein